jgi:hypothetical protein
MKPVGVPATVVALTQAVEKGRPSGGWRRGSGAHDTLTGGDSGSLNGGKGRGQGVGSDADNDRSNDTERG